MTLPITGFGRVSVVVTEYALFRFKNGQMHLEELCPQITLEELKKITPAEFTLSKELKIFS